MNIREWWRRHGLSNEDIGCLLLGGVIASLASVVCSHVRWVP